MISDVIDFLNQKQGIMLQLLVIPNDLGPGFSHFVLIYGVTSKKNVSHKDNSDGEIS
jgi:hypothetical protein